MIRTGLLGGSFNPAHRAHRAISGKSSGGYGAMVQSMRHPELFGAVANLDYMTLHHDLGLGEGIGK